MEGVLSSPVCVQMGRQTCANVRGDRLEPPYSVLTLAAASREALLHEQKAIRSCARKNKADRS